MSDIVSNLEHYWTFDEGSGTTGADTADSKDATLQASATWNSPGKIGASSLSTNGSSHYANTGSAVAAMADYTLAFWAYKVGAGSNDPRGIMVSQGDTYIDLAFSSQVLFSVNPAVTGQQLVSGGTPASTGAWAHYAGTYTSSTRVAKLYLNGSEVASQTLSVGSGSIQSANVVFSQYSGGGLFFYGYTDDVRIYSRTLSADDITALYAFTGGGASQSQAPRSFHQFSLRRS